MVNISWYDSAHDKHNCSNRAVLVQRSFSYRLGHSDLVQAQSDSLHFNASSAVEPPHFQLTAKADAAPYATAAKQDIAQYIVTVYTSDLPGAGTDCTAYICVHGKLGETGKQGMTVEGGSFGRGSVETALVEGPNVGQMLCACIGHNDEGVHL